MRVWRLYHISEHLFLSAIEITFVEVKDGEGNVVEVVEAKD